jgi:hypothetical protein
VPTKISASIATCGSVIAEPSFSPRAVVQPPANWTGSTARPRAIARGSPAPGRARVDFVLYVKNILRPGGYSREIAVWLTP